MTRRTRVAAPADHDEHYTAYLAVRAALRRRHRRVKALVDGVLPAALAVIVALLLAFGSPSDAPSDSLITKVVTVVVAGLACATASYCTRQELTWQEVTLDGAYADVLRPGTQGERFPIKQGPYEAHAECLVADLRAKATTDPESAALMVRDLRAVHIAAVGGWWGI